MENKSGSLSNTKSVIFKILLVVLLGFVVFQGFRVYSVYKEFEKTQSRIEAYNAMTISQRLEESYFEYIDGFQTMQNWEGEGSYDFLEE
jgi:uncharacterized membrane protein